MYICMYEWMYVCVYVCVDKCMYVCINNVIIQLMHGIVIQCVLTARLQQTFHRFAAKTVPHRYTWQRKNSRLVGAHRHHEPSSAFETCAIALALSSSSAASAPHRRATMTAWKRSFDMAPQVESIAQRAILSEHMAE